MEEKNELVVYGENGEILDCKFERVDFNNRPTIISYCDDVIDSIVSVLENSAKISTRTEQELIDSQTIDEITNFDKTLEKTEEKNQNPGLIVKAKRSVGSLLAKLGFNSLEEHFKEESLEDKRDQQQETLDQVKEMLGRQIERILMGIDITGSIIRDTEPLVNQLDVMIKVGHDDLNAFKEETEALATTADVSDGAAQREINVRRKVANLFEEQLSSLSGMSTSYYQALEEYELLQLADMSLVGTKTKQIKHGLPMMTTQADLMVREKEQARAIQEAKALDDAFNYAIKKNADQILTNVEATIDLSVNGGVKAETQEYVGEKITKAVELYRSRDKKIKDRMAKDKQIREKLKDERNKAKQDILGLFEDTLLTDGFSVDAPQKRLGGK